MSVSVIRGSLTMAHPRAVLTILVLPSLCYAQMSFYMQNQNIFSAARREMGGDCNRPCNGVKKTCEYTFTITNYVTMGSACGDCPFNVSHCYNPGCITAGGYPRNVQCVNGNIPGPCIRVCQGDTVRVEVQNMMSSEAATIHWHGIHQKGTPHMDGVPFVTQCPIHPNNKFVYEFEASQWGTHMYHGHVGMHDADGVKGCIVVGRPIQEEPNLETHGYNVIDHVMMLWHWFPSDTALHVFAQGRGRGVRVNGAFIIINGQGYGQEYYRDNQTYYTPPAEFKVKQGGVYRFRIIVGSSLYCAMQVSFQGHKMNVINSDTGSFVGTVVDSLMVGAGERYDVIIVANQTVRKYWITVAGHGFCAVNNVMQRAILTYEGATDELPLGTPTYSSSRVPGRLLNPISLLTTDYSNNELIYISNLTAFNSVAEDADIAGTPDQVFYFRFSQNFRRDGEMPGPLPQINNVTYVAHTSPCLTQRSDCRYCTDETKSQFCDPQDVCACHHVIEIKEGALVECIMFETFLPGAADHPIHFHGFDFHVLGMQLLPATNQTTEYVKYLNENGLIEKKFKGSPKKDTIHVPNGGLVAVRFRANNPGFWLVHCHLTNHMELGMALVLKVGEFNKMPKVPKDFPTCGNYPRSKSYVWQSSLHKKKTLL